MSIVSRHKQILYRDPQLWTRDEDDPSGGWGMLPRRRDLTFKLLDTDIPDEGYIVMLGTGVNHKLFNIWCDIWGNRVLGVNKMTINGLLTHKQIIVKDICEFVDEYTDINVAVCFNDISSIQSKREMGYYWALDVLIDNGIYIDSEPARGVYPETGKWYKGHFRPVDEDSQLYIYRKSGLNTHPFYHEDLHYRKR
jgi:hypothetical protein